MSNGPKWKSALIAAVGAAALLAPSIAMAQAASNKKKVAVFVVAPKKKTAAEAAAMQTLLRKQLSQIPAVRQVTGSPEPKLSFEQTVGSKLEQGFRLLNDKKGAEAEPIFQSVVDEAKKYTGAVDKRSLARALKGLGVARAMGGKLTAAREMIRASMIMWADQTAPEYAWSVEVRDTFTEVETRMGEEKLGSLSIETEPPGAEVTVGGEIKGFSPITIEELKPGNHFVQVQADGFIRAGALVNVPAGEEMAEAFALKPIAQKAAWDAAFKKISKKPGKKKLAKKHLPALKQILDVDGLLVMGLSSKKGYVFDGYYVNEQGALLKRRETITGDVNAILDQLGRMISRTVGSPLVKAQEPVPLDAPPQASVVTDTGDTLFVDPNDLLAEKQDDGDSVITKWWFWTILVVAIGGVGGLVGYLVTSEGEATGPVGTIVLDMKAAP